MNRKEPQKNRAKSSGAKGKIITIELVAFAFLAIYLAGYTFSMLKKPKIGTETVMAGQIDVPRQFDGLVLRDEVVTLSRENGTAVFSFGENEYVKKGSVVCAVKDGEALASLERQIETLSESILSQQANRNDAPAQSEEVKRINNRMRGSINEALPLFMTDGGSSVYRFKSQLEKDIETRNGILLSGSSDALATLVDRKTAFEQQLRDGTDTYASEYGGVLSFSVDGLEDELTPENRENVTREQVENPVLNPGGGEGQVEVGTPLFKVVKSNIWYLCAYLDNELVLDWKEGTSRPIYISEAGETRKITMRISNIELRDGKAFVVFSSSKHLIDFIDKRQIKFSLEDEAYKGLKIPNTAIVEKTVLLIPSEYIYESWGSTGVYVKENNSFVFKAVRVISGDEKTKYALQNFENVKLGTVVHLYKDGQGIEENSHTIEGLKTVPGVYVANSGSAEFRPISIVKKNEYFSVIEKGAGYGVQPFDNIVSVASSVADNQIIR